MVYGPNFRLPTHTLSLALPASRSHISTATMICSLGRTHRGIVLLFLLSTVLPAHQNLVLLAHIVNLLK